MKFGFWSRVSILLGVGLGVFFTLTAFGIPALTAVVCDAIAAFICGQLLPRKPRTPRERDREELS